MDRNNPNGQKQHGVNGYIKQYYLPFNQKNLKTLYDMRPAQEPSSVSLSIMKVGYDGNRIDWPHQIEKYEDFANRPFDELWDYVSNPKYKFDRTIRDNLEVVFATGYWKNLLFSLVIFGCRDHYIEISDYRGDAL